MSARLLYNDETVEQLLAEYRGTANARLRDAVVEHMRPLVQSVARKFAGREPLEDLESEGYVGLIRAVDRFTPGRGARFSTFATHLIAGQIRHYLRDRGHLIRQPAWLQELRTRVQRAAGDLEQRLHRPPTAPELAEATNLTEEAIEELLAARHAAQVVRMEALADDGDDDYLVVNPEKIRNRDYVTLQLPIEDRIVVESALLKLKELERKVLRAFFYQECNQSEIARRLGISCNYAGYVLRKGLKHLKERLPEDGAGSHGADETESIIDPLTRVYTLGYFEQRLREEVTRAQSARGEVGLSVLLLPDDCSPAAFRRVVEGVRVRTRRADVVGRTGERELGIIFPGAGRVIRSVSERLAEDLYDVAGLPVFVGSATHPQDGRTGEELLAAARADTVRIPTLPAPGPAPALGVR